MSLLPLTEAMCTNLFLVIFPFLVSLNAQVEAGAQDELLEL